MKYELTQTWIEITKSCSGSVADIFELKRSRRPF